MLRFYHGARSEDWGTCIQDSAHLEALLARAIEAVAGSHQAHCDSINILLEEQFWGY